MQAVFCVEKYIFCLVWECYFFARKTDLQFKNNSQGNLKQTEIFFLYLQLVYYILTIYYVWQNVLYLCYIKWVCTLTNVAFSPLFVQTEKAKLEGMECMQQDNSIYIHMLFLLFTKFLLSWFHDCEWVQCRVLKDVWTMDPWKQQDLGGKHKIRVLV